MLAENTCTFNDNKLLKSLRKNFQCLLELLCVYLLRFMRKWKLLPSIPGCGLYFPPRRPSEIPIGRGSKRKQFPRGLGSDPQGLLFPELLFLLMILHLTVIADCFFHSLPDVWYSLHVSNMNVIGSWIMLVIQLIVNIFHKIIVVSFTVLWSCSISLLLTCF